MASDPDIPQIAVLGVLDDNYSPSSHSLNSRRLLSPLSPSPLTTADNHAYPSPTFSDYISYSYPSPTLSDYISYFLTTTALRDNCPEEHDGSSSLFLATPPHGHRGKGSIGTVSGIGSGSTTEQVADNNSSFRLSPLHTAHSDVANTLSSTTNTQPPPDKLQSTLSSWLKNINKLDSLINRLHQLASSAPTDHRPQLLNKVVGLRAMFKKQQERCIEFLRLSEDYADKYLLDIDAEIRQQSTLLDNLEERLEAAKKLHGDAVELQILYESGTVASMNDLRTKGKAVPVICTCTCCKANY